MAIQVPIIIAGTMVDIVTSADMIVMTGIVTTGIGMICTGVAADIMTVTTGLTDVIEQV